MAHHPIHHRAPVAAGHPTPLRLPAEIPAWGNLLARLLLLLAAVFLPGQFAFAQDAHAAASGSDPALATAAHQPRANMKSLTVGVLDFSSPQTAPWLGTAMAEAVYTKLLGVSGLQLAERQRLRELLLPGEEPQAAKLGCAVLVSGTIQHTGVWPQGRLRVSVKLIAAESGLLQEDGAFVLDEDAAGIFRLEDALAQRLGAILGRPAAASELARRNARNLEAEEAFGRGLDELARAGLLPPAERARARDLASAAVLQFQSAQKRNGVFFPAAHDYEGVAWETVARLQDTPQEAAQVRAATVAKFRADAADAAAAFFDLGRALEYTGDCAGALSAYRDYRVWMSGRNRVLSWSLPYDDISVVPYYTGQDHQLRCCPPERYTFLHDQTVVVSRKNGLLCGHARSDGRELWRLQLPAADGEPTHARLLLWNQAVFYVLGTDFLLRAVETATGRITATVPLPFYHHRYQVGNLVQLGLTDGSPARLFVRQFANYDDQRDDLRFDELAAFDPVTLRLLWQSKGRNLYDNQVWLLGGRIILKEYDPATRRRVLDPETGNESATAIAPELLPLLGFAHKDIGGWFPDADLSPAQSEAAQTSPSRAGTVAGPFSGCLVLAKTGNRDEAVAYQIHNISHPPHPDASCQGALLPKENGDGMLLFTTPQLGKDVNRIFCRNPQSGRAQALVLNRQELATLGCNGKGGSNALNIELSADRLSLARNVAVQEVYATRPGLQLLWRYQTTGILSSSPLLGENGMIVVAKSLEMRHAELLSLNIPSGTQTITEADALCREGECLRRLGRSEEALASFRAAQHSNAASIEAAYGAARVLLDQGKPLSAWEQGRLFLNDAPATDPRREQLWRELAKTCGLVWIEQPSSWPGMRYLPQRTEFIGIDNGAIRVIPLDPLKKSPRVLPHKLGGEMSVVAVQDNRLFVYADEAANPPRARLLEYDLDHPRELRTLPAPGYRRVRVAFWDTNQTMREACDRLPLLLHDGNSPERFELVDPGRMQAVSTFALDEPIEPWLSAAHQESGNGAQSAEECYEIAVNTIPADRMIVIAGYSPDKERPHYVLAGYAPQEGRVVWQTRVEMSARAALARHNGWHGRRIALVPLGSRFVFSATLEEHWTAFDTLTGLPSGARWPEKAVWPRRLPYLFPAALLLNTRAWVDTSPCEAPGEPDSAYGSTPLWPGGPMLLENCDLGKTVTLAQPASVVRPASAPVPSWPVLTVQEDASLVNGMMVVPPYTFLLVRVNPRRWDHFILRNDVPFYGRYAGWQAPVFSGGTSGLLPLWTERADYTPRYPLPDRAPQGSAATSPKP